jgi:hypothetical protein
MEEVPAVTKYILEAEATLHHKVTHTINHHQYKLDQFVPHDQLLCCKHKCLQQIPSNELYAIRHRYVIIIIRDFFVYLYYCNRFRDLPYIESKKLIQSMLQAMPEYYMISDIHVCQKAILFVFGIGVTK